EYRVGQLPAARARASELHRHGARFPWRTIAGPEAAAYYPAGTAQLHINADVAVALQRYLAVTGALDLVWAGGAEVVLACARFYSHYGVVGSDGLFHLRTVTGPDEYTALVDDNHFTNKMARETLSFAAALATTLRDHDPDGFARLGEKLGLSSGELETFAEQASL